MRVSLRLLEQAGKAAASRFNTRIDLESPKVASLVKVDELKGKKTAFCRCWRSSKFPLCDGSHSKHNQETGDNLGPLIVQKEAEAK